MDKGGPQTLPAPEAEAAARETRSTCPYCGVGCGVIIESRGAAITGVRGDPDHPANFGRLCSKGNTLHLTAAPRVQMQARALQPLRRPSRGGPLQACTWDDALDEVATRLAAIVNTHGPDAVGLYLSGQLLTEDYYVFNKLAKGLIGTNNVDTNSRLCMSSAVAGYKASLGADSVPNAYEDLDHARTVFISGSNMAWAHPVLYRRLEAARRARPGMRVIVVDPRRTETAAEADLHLQLLPGTDVALHHGLLHLMLWEGWIDPAYLEAHTSGWAALRDRVREFTPAHTARITGLREADLMTAARWFAGVPEAEAGAAAPRAAGRTPTLSLWCQGLNQSHAGTDKNTTLINLHLATGQIGRPGAGPLSLTGQPNAMGGREVGGLANLLSAHRDLAQPEHRAEVAALWGVRHAPVLPGLSAVPMFEAAAEGRLKALWIVCTNPAQSLPDQALVRRALERCEFVVVQEAYRHTATVGRADVLLPAASWGEKEGTVTNSERRITRVRAAVPAPGEARADWRIAVQVARRLEALLPERRTAGGVAAGRSLFPYDEAEAVWNEHRESTRGRDLDITGLSYALLDAAPRQWPCAEGTAPEATPARLYADGRFATADGRARLHAPAYRPTAELRDARHPFALTTGRLRDHWHGMSRTGTLGRLFAHGGEAAVELHPQELQRRRWNEGDLVRVQSRRGTLLLPVRASETVAPAQAFIAMHWGEEWLGGREGLGVNALTTPARCPQSQQPELKHAAVRIERADLPWTLVAAGWLPAGEALGLREQLQALLKTLPYLSCTLFGHEPGEAPGLLLRAAAAAAPDAATVAALESAFGLGAGTGLRYADTQRGRVRSVRLSAQGTLQAFVLAGETQAAPWMLEWLQQHQPAAAQGRQLLAGGATPPVATAVRGRAVCSCMDVGEAAIREAAQQCWQRQPAADLAACLGAVQDRTRCGTSCGSCVPAVKALLRQLQPQAAAA